ncbi:MAG: hypothetical protein DRJ05_16770 [Bacteroidetes bacterium]|nr:MAG: hypothetical protein DRJ05_16770 [Bacteroidota bacterium]
MNIIDENIIASQCDFLQKWHIPFSQIGYGVGIKGMQDQEIISLLHKLKRPTFFTRDDDFFNEDLCHSGYCLVYLDINKDEAAIYIRRLIRNINFNSQQKRLGNVLKISYSGLIVWKLNAEIPQKYFW